MKNKTTISLVKLVLFSTAISFLVFACNSIKSKNDELSVMVSERDSLITLKDKINLRLGELEEGIANLDTSRRLALVTVVESKQDTFEHFVNVLGEVQAEKNAEIFPETPGTIRAIYVKVGQYVNKNDLLLGLDTEVIKRSLDEVNVQLDLAKTVFEKRKRLWDQKIGSEIEYLQAKNQFESLESRRSTLRAQLALSEIRAPFAGFVDIVNSKVGELASPQMPVMRLVALDEIYLEADLSEVYLSKVKKGTPVRIEFPGLGMVVVDKIDQVSNFIRSENRTFRIRVELENRDNILKPNLMANLRIQDYRADSAFVLPNRVIQQAPDGRSYVYVVELNKDDVGMVRKQYVETGMSTGAITEIISGLKGGEKVIDKGARVIKENERVKISA